MNPTFKSYFIKKSIINLLKEKALQAACEKERGQREAEAEMEKLHLELRKNQELMNLQVEDLDDYIYTRVKEEKTPISRMLEKLKAASAKRKVDTTPYKTRGVTSFEPIFHHSDSLMAVEDIAR